MWRMSHRATRKVAISGGPNVTRSSSAASTPDGGAESGWGATAAQPNQLPAAPTSNAQATDVRMSTTALWHHRENQPTDGHPRACPSTFWSDALSERGQLMVYRTP